MTLLTFIIGLIFIIGDLICYGNTKRVYHNIWTRIIPGSGYYLMLKEKFEK